MLNPPREKPEVVCRGVKRFCPSKIVQLQGTITIDLPGVKSWVRIYNSDRFATAIGLIANNGRGWIRIHPDYNQQAQSLANFRV